MGRAVILVTGATGNLGGLVARKLLGRGEAVRVLARDPRKAAPLAEAGAEVARGDFADPRSLDAALAGAGRVFVVSTNGPHEARLRLHRGAIAAAADRYGSETAAVVEGTVVLVEVGRLPRGERRRKPKALWLWWHGAGEPDLDLLWKAYCRRFDIEHFVKFLKGSLGWTTPRVRHPEQADRWTWLVLAAYAQLLLARGVVADRRLPWEKPLPAGALTPTRVLRNFAALLPLMGTPARAPKPRGRSPGRPKGSLSGPARRYPAVKKAAQVCYLRKD